MTDSPETRPWRNGDLDALRASESLFTPDSYPQRFLAGARRLRPLYVKVAEQLAVPGRRWIAQVATDGNRLVALAECAWDPADPESPRLTVNVADAHRRGDLGRRTLRGLASRCLSLGPATFTVDYAASNLPLRSLLEPIAVETGVRYSLQATTAAGIGHITVHAAK